MYKHEHSTWRVWEKYCTSMILSHDVFFKKSEKEEKKLVLDKGWSNADNTNGRKKILTYISEITTYVYADEDNMRKHSYICII